MANACNNIDLGQISTAFLNKTQDCILAGTGFSEQKALFDSAFTLP